MGKHDFPEKHAVLELRVRYAAIAWMGLYSKPVKCAAHVNFLAGLHVKEREIDRTATAMAGVFQDVSQLEEDGLVEIAVEA